MAKAQAKDARSMVYDENGYRLRAACICFRDNAKQKVLLVTSRHHNGWVVPGGGIESGEEAEHAAIRELQEEAGVVGTIAGLLGIFNNETKKTRTTVFTAVATTELETWAEAESTLARRREWFTLEEAHAQLSLIKPVQKLYIEELMSRNSDT